MKTRLKIGRLTKGERLFVLRRRAGVSQVRRAQELGVSPFVYGLAERDVQPDAVLCGSTGELTDAERCVVLRRRSGRPTAELADAVGCSRMWLRNMEQAKVPIDRLTAYWIGQTQ